jgi:hypothetical protein
MCSLQRPRPSLSGMEQAIVAIINVFHKYSGNKSKLKKAELKHLINNEMSQFIMVSQTFQYGYRCYEGQRK